MTYRQLHRRARFAPPAVCESLESRLFLSASHPLAGAATGPVDIAITGVSGLKLDNSIVTGLSESGSLKVAVKNNGSGSSGSTAVSITAVLRPLFGAADVPITVKPGILKNLAGHKSKPVPLSLRIPASLLPGSYQLVLTADTGTLTDTDATNNSFTVPSFQLDSAAGNVSLSGDLSLVKIPTTFAAGKVEKGSLKITLSNAGNLPTPGGSARVDVALRPTSGTDIPLFSKTVKVPSVANGSTKPTNLPAVPLTLPATVPAGAYTVIITITPTDLSATNPAITLESPTITVTAGTPVGGSSILEHGDQITFTANTNLNGGPQNFLEMGSFVTDKHVTGSYTLTGAALTLTYSSSDVQTLPVTFTGGNLQFFDSAADEAGKKVTFSLDPTNAILSLAVPTTSSTETVYAQFA